MSDDSSDVPSQVSKDCKTELRRLLRARRAILSQVEHEAASRAITTRVLELCRIETARVALYLASPLEPNMDVLIDLLQARGGEVLAPHFQDELQPFYTLACGGENIENSQYRNAMLREPRAYSGGHAYNPAELDVILIPGLAFDLQGNRIGQGGGWYDRVLARAHNALKIGVAFDCQIVEDLPHEAHDIPMNFVVTEKRLLEF